MAAFDDQSIKNAITCPLCQGEGSLKETYPYKALHKYDAGGQSFTRSETCWFCQGSGVISPEQQLQWLQFETYEPCPQCNGTGGKRYWTWEERDDGTHKEFSFVPCRLCGGKKRVSPQQMAIHHRERRQLRIWGIGCVALAVIVLVFGSTFLLGGLLRGTPFLRCCPAGGFLPIGIVIAYNWSKRNKSPIP